MHIKLFFIVERIYVLIVFGGWNSEDISILSIHIHGKLLPCLYITSSQLISHILQMKSGHYNKTFVIICRRGLQTFLFEGHISCYSTVRGPHKLLLNSPRAGHRTKCDCFRKCFCQINKFSFVILFFLVGKMSTRAGWNGFAGRIWPAGRSLVTPDLPQTSGYSRLWK